VTVKSVRYKQTQGVLSNRRLRGLNTGFHGSIISVQRPL
jgi:hypothetical protein